MIQILFSSPLCMLTFAFLKLKIQILRARGDQILSVKDLIRHIFLTEEGFLGVR